MAFQAMNHGLEARATSSSRRNEPALPTISSETSTNVRTADWSQGGCATHYPKDIK